jgi:DNA-binding NarL/FixJ family response regulator
MDRHPLWLDAMEKLLVALEVEVVGRTTNADEAVRLVEGQRPDVFVAGIDVGSADQVACVRRAREACPDVRAVVVDDSTEPDEIDAAFEAGATVYCVKTATQDDLASAIRQVFERSIFLATEGIGRSGGSGSATSAANAAAAELTRREHEILRLVAEGHSNSQLAKMLWVTEQTVKFHLSNIYRKLDVSNRTEASRWAQLHGLLSTRPESELSLV